MSRLTQLGAGGEVSLPPIIPPRVVAVVIVSAPTTRMSPAGMPFAFTVMEPPMDTLVWTAIGLFGCTVGGRSEVMLGQPGSTGTMTTGSPRRCSVALAPEFRRAR